MRGANRLLRLVGIGSAPAGVASQGTRSGGAGAPPGGTMTRREELADGRAFRPAEADGAAAQKGPRRRPKAGDWSPEARPGAAKTPRRRAERRHAGPKARVHIRTGRAAWRAVPLAFLGGDFPRSLVIRQAASGSQTSGACAPRERWSLPAMNDKRDTQDRLRLQEKIRRTHHKMVDRPRRHRR